VGFSVENEVVPSDNAARIQVDRKVYDRDVLLRALHSYTDRAYILVMSSEIGYEVCFTKKPNTKESVQDIVGEFMNALLDQGVRQQINRETGRIRELIVAKAFAEGNFLEDPPPGDDRDPVELGKQPEQ
jgi:His-Xaa-Ser system protein HxsD